MNTRLRISRGAKPSPPATASTCPTISPGVRFRPKPIAPVAQNAHLAGQPTMVDTQMVLRSRYGMYTASICRPSISVNRYFTLPSALRTVSISLNGFSWYEASSSARAWAGRLVMASKVPTPCSNTHSSNCLRRKPCSG